ncbi:GntR family transcriptional regulator [Streptomyces sp. HNM0574]|uniref:GntR family transcriptional regulator n=1 Tax=Streptomyces sp. HNM0574 TaxID=2714954 RepID=UPI00146F53E1|nr:GntR family transcriptional regulator [Streptomyces sp. HNM0574]NLU69225.1 GntR family transcriptional regulator [Streptomyces sp. HNM0574]
MAGRQIQRRPVVTLYERIVDAIREGTYPPGSQLPTEPRLATELGVSRPALREALILLQEDGVITVRRGVGRTVSQHLPPRGFEYLKPVEQLLSEGQPARTSALLRTVEEPTDFSTQHLLLPARSEVRFWESRVDSGGVPCCLTQEWSAPDEVLAEHVPEAAGLLDGPDSSGSTMLALLLRAGRGLPLSGASTVVATMLGRQRGEQFGRSGDTPAVLVTQVVRLERTPLLAAKYMLPSGAPALPVWQAR